ncbi:hypothetical protein OG204_35085 [Streptomyces sp. NBC_01387]|uniref:hypothetical protein n=1 Tax=unclassified Streptomyces TaxID=2593676 RepID=UPI0022599473|nr:MULTISPECIES: hypothetical protein [unclassified Streptomyces]MCX4553186.1 hypothetical protein [Streptomyces sp. NBC_01500]WSC18162.1 hypothetical protein OIE60_00025 [Streptomyces sp. NBC_01766]
MITADEPVVVFEGWQAGTGFDGEPTAVPEHVIETLPWTEFLQGGARGDSGAAGPAVHPAFDAAELLSEPVAITDAVYEASAVGGVSDHGLMTCHPPCASTRIAAAGSNSSSAPVQ